MLTDKFWKPEVTGNKITGWLQKRGWTKTFP